MEEGRLVHDTFMAVTVRGKADGRRSALSATVTLCPIHTADTDATQLSS